MSGDPRIDALIESIADGSPVDWDALEASAANDSERRVLRHLRLVANVAEVHRTILSDPAPDDQPIGPSPALMEIGEVGQAIPRWGHLLLLDKIGEGTFGEVYRARDPWLDREVALKLVKPGVSIPAARILHEAQTLARVRHPNVVMVHGADMHDGRVGLWMEFVRGRSLGQVLGSQGPFSAGEAAVIGQELCRALAAVHRAGLVHRDIKVQNVMRESGGRLVLMDFGAGELVEGPQAARPAGTPLYLAPEVLEGGQATVQADIYSLGVLLYHLVTGAFPATGTSIEELRLAHERGELRRLRDVRPELPDTFVAVVEKALDHTPSRRFASAGDMQHALARVTSPGLSGYMRAIAAEKVEQRPRPRPWRDIAVAVAVVLAIAAALITATCWYTRPPPPAAPNISVIAVLPFQNLSQDPDEGYLANAVPMELTARLGAVGALRVVPWTFTSRFRSGPGNLEDVVATTKADAVIEGTVQVLSSRALRDGNRRVRLRVQLYRALTGALLWTDAYERNLSDFFGLQADIAQAVARQVNAVVARREEIHLAQARRVGPDAMEDYLRGREALGAHQDIAGAIASFQSAVRREPAFAEAHAGLAQVYTLESAYVGAVPSSVARERAMPAANRAIELDPEMADAYTARAFARMQLSWDWAGAESDLSHALKLNPNAAAVHDERSLLLTARGRHDEAIAAARRAEEREPLSATHSRQVAWALYMARRYEEAIAQLRRTLEIEPSYVPAKTLLGRANALVGRYDDAIRELQEAGRPHEPRLTLVYAIAGRSAEATRLLQQITSPSYTLRVGPYELSVIHAALGNRPASLSYLTRAFRERDPALTMIHVDPMFDPIRGEPTFQDILRRMNLRP